MFSLDIATKLALFLLLIALSSLLSMAEASLVAVSMGRVHSLEVMGHRRARLILSFLKQREKYLRSILCANTAANIFSSAAINDVMYPLYGTHGVIYGSLLCTILILIFGEILPKSYAVRNPSKVAIFVAPFVLVCMHALTPITYFFDIIVNGLQSLLRIDKSVETSTIAEDIKGLVAMYSRYDVRPSYDLRMLGSIVDLYDTEVSEVMTHRTEVFTINISDDLEKIISSIVNVPFSRIPVWRDNPDNVIGILYIKNLAHTSLAKGTLTKEDIISSCFDPWYIPDTISLSDQLTEFRKRKIHFAVVVNEYGVFQGIITLEDIIEEIVGTIYDEHDIEKNMLLKIRDDEYIVDGSCPLRDFNRETGLDMSCEDASTIGGMVLYLAERLPEVGENFRTIGATLKVVAIKEKKVSMIHVQKIKDEDSD